MRRAILLAGLTLLSTAGIAQLNGTYTINDGAPATATNYQSVTAAISDLSLGTRADGGPTNGPGVSGPVTLRIAAGSGPYTQQISIPAIAGASAVNTIRISGNTTRETITFNANNTTSRHLIRLNGADHIILDSLTLINTGIFYGYGVHLTNDADSNIISNSIIRVDSAASNDFFAGIIIAGNTPTTLGNHGDGNTVINNIVYGGYYGYVNTGTSSTVFSANNSVINNQFRGFYYGGIRMFQQQSPVVTGNYIQERQTGSLSGQGIYCFYNEEMICTGNNILRVGNHGIYVAYQNTLGTGRTLVANNMMNMFFASPHTGIYLHNNAINVDIYHNSIRAGGNQRAIYLFSSSAAGVNIVNNSCAVTGSTSGYALYVTSASSVNTVDFNNYYAPGSSNFIYIGTPYTQANYVGGGGFNANSIDGDPGYLSLFNNLHVQTHHLSNVGTNLGITTDIDGDARPTGGGYDIGADEFIPIDYDATFVAFTDPNAQQCAEGAQPIEVTISNNGNDPILTLPITVEVSGYLNTTLNYTYNGNLVYGASATVTVGTINTFPGGTLNFTGYTSLAGEQRPSNDTVRYSAVFISAAPAVANVDTTCVGHPAQLSVVADGFLHSWYDAVSGGNFLGDGDTLITPPLSGPTTYYVESTAPRNDSLSTTMAAGNGCMGIMFDIVPFNGIRLDSLLTHINSTDTVEVRVYYRVGTHVGHEFTPGDWTLLWVDSVDAQGYGNTTLIPAGGLTMLGGQPYGIYITVHTSTMIYTDGLINYSNLDLTLYSGTGMCFPFSGDNPGRIFNGTIYYSKDGCAYPVRTPVTAETVSPHVVSLLSASDCDSVILNAGNPGAGYLWSNGDTTQQSVITSSGNVSVSVTTQYCTVSDTASVTIFGAPSLTIAADGSVCAGQSDTLVASGAASWLWSSGGTAATEIVSPAVSQYYTVTGTDINGCSSTDSIFVTVNSLPTVALNFSATTLCSSAGTLILNGESPAGGIFYGTAVSGNTFNATSAGPGMHTITYQFTDVNGCSGADSTIITVNASPIVTLNLPLDTFCLGSGSVALSGESPAGGTFSGPAVTGNSFNVDTAGIGTHTITYTYTDVNGCTSLDSQSVMVDPCLGVNHASAQSFSLHPNPNNGSFTITLGENISEMKFVMYNSMGEAVMSFTLNANAVSLTNETLPAGIYLLNGASENGTFTKTIVIE